MTDRLDMLDDVAFQMRDAGLEPFTRSSPEWQLGKLTRCLAKGDSHGEKTGWYVLHEYRTDEGKTLFFGSFGDWRSGVSHKVKVKGARLTPEEKEVMRARQEKARQDAAERAQQAARRAARRARGLWEALPEKGRHPYLDRKQIVGMGVRYARNGALVVPMKRPSGLVGVQLIWPEKQEETGRDKQYWPFGVAKEGAYCLIGPHPEPGEPILIAEGYATGVSLYMATSLTVAMAFDAGNLLPVGKTLREEFPGRALIFCADDDWKTEINGQPTNVGVQKAENAAVVLGGQKVVPIFSEGREDGWTDWNDLHVAEGLDAVRRQVMAVVKPAADEGWRMLLRRTSNGGLVSHMINVAMILGNDERWEGVLGFNRFSGKTMKLRTAPYGGEPGEWTDLDDMLTAEWLAHHYQLLAKSSTVLEGVSVTASKNAYHPVVEYLEGLEWDGVSRLESWLYVGLGVPLSPYSMKVASRWMIGAVARVMKPGSKVDNVLILEGAQGAGKSTALSVLGGDWFMDTPFNLGDKEAYQQIRGKWIVELGELDAFNKADSTKAKQFFSASTDTFRESYGRRSCDLPRQCVFAGTTNQDEYLKDTTGNRRYWPVRAETVNLEALREMRDQLWAEALFLYKAGTQWWVTKEETALFSEEQDARYAVDAWEYKLRPWLESHVGETVTADQVLGDALNLDFGHWGKPEQMRVGHIMNRLAWRRVRMAPTPSGQRPWAYKRPESWKRAAQPAQGEDAF